MRSLAQTVRDFQVTDYQ